MSQSVIKSNELDKALIRQSFDRASGHYNQFTSLQRTIGDRLMTRCVGEQLQLKSILDLGAGTGYLTNKLTERYSQSGVYALDIALGMLQQTRLNVAQPKSLDVICSDVEKLPFKPGSMDGVYSNLAFQWSSDLDRTFSESHAVLRNGGEFSFATFGPGTLKELKHAWSFADNQTHVNSFASVDTIRSALIDAGFEAIQISTENLVLNYNSPKALMLDLKGMGAHNINQSRARGLMGVRAYKRMLSAYQTLESEAGLPATFQALYVQAKKRV